jgi:NADPH-dependent 2,4-dienoyl-CoA reductase/sulfur reductase-like enzyme
VVKVEQANAETVVHLASGDELVSDLVVLAVGSQPVVDWLAGTGLDVSAGVVCDETCAIEGLDDAVAAGDVAQWLNPLYGARMRVEHWTNAIEQGTYAARRLLGRHDPAGFVSVPYFWSNQGDLKIESAGSTLAYDECRITAVEGDRIVVTYGLAGRLVAVAGVGATVAVIKGKKLIAAGASIDDGTVAETCR